MGQQAAASPSASTPIPAAKFLSPPPPTLLHCVRPFQRPGAQTCAGGLVRSGPALAAGDISYPRVHPAADAKLSVTPRGRDATRGNGGGQPLCLCGAAMAASILEPK